MVVVMDMEDTAVGMALAGWAVQARYVAYHLFDLMPTIMLKSTGLPHPLIVTASQHSTRFRRH